MDFVVLAVDDFVVGPVEDVGLDILGVGQEECKGGKNCEFFYHFVFV